MLFISYKLVIYFTNEPQTHLNRNTKQKKRRRKTRGRRRKEKEEEEEEEEMNKKKGKGHDYSYIQWSRKFIIDRNESMHESGTYRRLQNGHDQTVMD